MQTLDWIIIVLSMFIVVGAGVYAQKYVKGVADFLSAGRVARRYVLAIGKSELGAGAVLYVAFFEQVRESGFTNTWWGTLSGPVGLFLTIMGFVVYRYRETRAMTLGQFFEIRYSRNFRLFAGVLGFVAGLLNFGIMPMVGARVMVYFLGLPVELHFFGATLPTYIPLMALFLFINFIVSASGGILTVIITNCIEGLVSQFFYVLLIIGLMVMFPWSQISNMLKDAPPGHSLINPMDTSGLKDFNIWFVFMIVILGNYRTMSWQNQSGYNSAPLNAHEARMSNLIVAWKGLGQAAVGLLLAICAMTYLHDPAWATGAAHVHSVANQIQDEHTRKQMELPLAMINLLPVGLKGALCAAMLLGIFGGDANALHSWGSIFIQDVVVPLRKKALTPVEHIRILRYSMAGVALFAFLFGVFCNPHQYIIMWWWITMSLFVGGASVAIIGGLYWEKGTTSAAWWGMITGCVLSMVHIAADQMYAYYHWGDFPINGTSASFYVMLISIAVYVVVSLLTFKEKFNLERMLHRGIYANISAEVGDELPKRENRKITMGKIIGYDENFSLMDKWLAGGLFGWTSLWTLITIFGTLWWFTIGHWSDDAWSSFWYVGCVLVPVCVAFITTIWFGWSGSLDVIDLFRRLKRSKNNPLDNGMVIDNQNLDESVLPDAISPIEKDA